MFKKNKKKIEEEFQPAEVPEDLQPDSDMKEIKEEVLTEPKPIEEPLQQVEEPISVSNLTSEVQQLEEKIKLMKQTQEKEKQEEVRLMVVKQLPEAPLRDYKDKDGSTVHLITTEEAIMEILNLLRKEIN